jgi:hypothetical protein
VVTSPNVLAVGTAVAGRVEHDRTTRQKIAEKGGEVESEGPGLSSILQEVAVEVQHAAKTRRYIVNFPRRESEGKRKRRSGETYRLFKVPDDFAHLFPFGTMSKLFPHIVLLVSCGDSHPFRRVLIERDDLCHGLRMSRLFLPRNSRVL